MRKAIEAVETGVEVFCVRGRHTKALRQVIKSIEAIESGVEVFCVRGRHTKTSRKAIGAIESGVEVFCVRGRHTKPSRKDIEAIEVIETGSSTTVRANIVHFPSIGSIVFIAFAKCFNSLQETRRVSIGSKAFIPFL